MSDMRSAFGLRVHTPCGPRKSGMPESVEMPAPVRTTRRSASSISERALSIPAFMSREQCKYSNTPALERFRVELEPQPRFVGYGQLTVHRLRHFLPQLRRPRHILDGETVRNRRNHMHGNLRAQVIHDRQIERLSHAGDLHPLRDAARAYHVDHHDVDRTRFEHVAEWYETVDVFASRNRRRQRLRNAREARVVVMGNDVLQPEETILLHTVTDRDRLPHVPALIDIAHEVDLGADRVADDADALLL